VKSSLQIIDLSAVVFPLYAFERKENIQRLNESRIVAFILVYFVSHEDHTRWMKEWNGTMTVFCALCPKTKTK